MMTMQRYLLILCIFIVLLTPVTGATISVSSGESLQAAINAATDGDILLIEAGTYPEPIVINRSITLRGEGHPVIDARRLLNRDAVTITAPNVTFQGVMVVNSSRAGINVSAPTCQIIASEISWHAHSGIAIRSVNGTTIRDTIIHDISSGSPGYGIYLSQAGDARMENVSTQNTNGTGIYLYRSTNVSINDATITGALSHGVFIRMSSTVTLTGSTITGNGIGATTYGVIVENSPSTYLTANHIVDNRCHGIRLYFADDTTVSETTIAGAGVRSVCTGIGMVIESTSSAVLTRNMIHDHATGLQLLSSPGTVVYQNTFRSLSQPVTVLTSSATWQSPSP
ncbi:MAG: right-handed parallel beta-helix repeat-containing protein, partial [Methanomicrobiales archaeon]|nr:right-handed parallel beta-helix repeat-containing protein [Methanomicrobiales archaeon]